MVKVLGVRLMEKKERKRARTKRRETLKLKKPTIKETFMIMGVFAAFYIFNDMVNIISIDEAGHQAIGNFFNNINVPVIWPMWIALIIFILLLTLLVTRSVHIKGIHRRFDTYAGAWMFVGLILFAMATALNLQGIPAEQPIAWFFDVTRNGVYHLGLVGFFIPGLVYFAATE